MKKGKNGVVGLKIGDRIDKEIIDNMLKANKEWENQREKSGLGKMTQKDRITQTKINIAKTYKDIKDTNKEIIRLYILFGLQVLVNIAVIIGLNTLK